MIAQTPLQEQLWIVLYALLSGAVFGMLYDIFREIRWNSSRWVELLLDGIFCILLAVFLFVFVTAVSQNRLRGFILIAMLLGSIIWNFTLGKPFRRGMMYGCRMLAHILALPYRFYSLIRNRYRSYRKNRENAHKFFGKSQEKQK